MYESKLTKVSKYNKGITLIVLIITIIVLLILATVTIRLSINGGVINNAEKGKKSYIDLHIKDKILTAYNELQTSKKLNINIEDEDFLKQRIEAQDLTVNTINTIEDGWEIGIDNKTYILTNMGNITVENNWQENENKTFSREETNGVQVGDIVHYETILAKTENALTNSKLTELKTDLNNYSGYNSSSDNAGIDRENLTWRVLDIKDGKLRLISSEPTTQKIALQHYNGYNNGVYLLDKVCDTLYSANEVGRAQNLKIEDIEERLSYNYRNFENSNVDTGKYGGVKEYTSNLYYPNIYSKEIGCKAVSDEENKNNTLGLSEQKNLITGNSVATDRLKTTQTFWSKEMEKSDFKDLDSNSNSKYYTLFINNGSNYSSYWLSSRCVVCSPDYAEFYMRLVEPGKIFVCYMCYSGNYGTGNSYAFRPVVSLNYDVKLSGNSTDGWTIVE